MKILLINQPVSNRGDEAAHRGLMRALHARYPDAKLTVVFLGVDPESVRGMQVQSPNIDYALIPLRRAEKAVLRSGASCVSRLGTTLCVFWGELLSVTSAKAVVRRALREEPLKISALHSGERTVLLHRHNYARSPDTPVLHAA